MTASLSKQIKDWVSQTNDWFSYWQLDEALGIVHPKDKNIRRVIIWQLYNEGQLFRIKKRGTVMFKLFPRMKLANIM